MTLPVHLYGPLATHPRGRILQEASGATPCAELPMEPSIILAFAEGFQCAEEAEQARMIEWTRTPGHVLVLLPPFVGEVCNRPVAWWAERLDVPPHGGAGLAKLLAPEARHRLQGKLLIPAIPGANWSDLSACVGVYRLHPAAGLFIVTTLPLGSLTLLDSTSILQDWFTSLEGLLGPIQPQGASAPPPLSTEHFGLLVFLLSRSGTETAHALEDLAASPVFRIPPDRGRVLLQELRDRGLVNGAVPTTEADELVMRSPYAFYVSALREVNNR